ncbi:hypothetical protein MKK67_06290 [Methylobacterium sp. J-072]|uniref:hypothetical protein n=1 Tax=Methylobacterium sp. J-072 TaxID=2836651 RepID=UPI001FBA261E|nr:hypothetical protein [Methylobacterium sp. J-072]MCJ2092109.1 hypothetical protein [Methylobacterium sp. J-072]
MSASGKHHRSTPTEIFYSLWLTFDQDGNVRLNRESPRLSPDERAMRVEVRVPKALWNIPQLSAEITVPDPGQPDAIAARIEQFAEQLKTAVGCDVVLTVKPVEEPR